MAQKTIDPPYEAFKKLLFSDVLKAGQFVTQKELLDLTKAPLGPLRTALVRLEVEGFIQVLPQRGIQIAGPSFELFRNITQVRLALEKEAWTKYALSADDETLAEEERYHLDLIDKIEAKTVTPALLKSTTAHDREMHDKVIAALHNDLYLRIFRINMERILLIRPDRGNINANSILFTTQEHLAIIRGCIERDVSVVSKAVETHLMSAVHRFLKL